MCAAHNDENKIWWALWQPMNNEFMLNLNAHKFFNFLMVINGPIKQKDIYENI